MSRHTHLPRLAPQSYCGDACVHWIHTTKNRTTGWLDLPFHLRFREILTHTLSRNDLVCPVYCLMPDHMHLLWIGIHEERDQCNQRTATRHFRKHLNRLLEGEDPVAEVGRLWQNDAQTTDTHQFQLQRQPYDHVLRDEERERDAFQSVAHYILQNPIRAKLVSEEDVASYPFAGCLVPGYPHLSVHEPDYWDTFWNLITGAH